MWHSSSYSCWWELFWLKGGINLTVMDSLPHSHWGVLFLMEYSGGNLHMYQAVSKPLLDSRIPWRYGTDLQTKAPSPLVSPVDQNDIAVRWEKVKRKEIERILFQDSWGNGDQDVEDEEDTTRHKYHVKLFHGLRKRLWTPATPPQEISGKGNFSYARSLPQGIVEYSPPRSRWYKEDSYQSKQLMEKSSKCSLSHSGDNKVEDMIMRMMIFWLRLR